MLLWCKLFVLFKMQIFFSLKNKMQKFVLFIFIFKIKIFQCVDVLVNYQTITALPGKSTQLKCFSNRTISENKLNFKWLVIKNGSFIQLNNIKKEIQVNETNIYICETSRNNSVFKKIYLFLINEFKDVQSVKKDKVIDLFVNSQTKKPKKRLRVLKALSFKNTMTINKNTFYLLICFNTFLITFVFFHLIKLLL